MPNQFDISRPNYRKRWFKGEHKIDKNNYFLPSPSKATMPDPSLKDQSE